MALKRLRDADPRSVYAFKREFRALANASHPNLASLHELFLDGCDFYLSMDLVHGVSITEYLRPGSAATQPSPLSVRQEISEAVVGALRTDAPAPPGGVEEGAAAATLPQRGRPAVASHTELDWDSLRSTFAQLADALVALHAAGIFHRDLKPSNVLVDKSGRVVVLDFGLIATMESADGHRGRSIVGTPAYMAPETCLGLPYQEASDWFSAGVVLFEVLTGELPHSAENLADLIWHKVRRGVVTNVSALNSAVPDDLARLCHDLLQRDPMARPSGAEVRRRLGYGPASVESPGWGASAFSRAAIDRVSPLVGRKDELRALRDAFEATTRAGPVLVRVEGVSGMGKSALVETFLDVVARRDHALVLRGRCYQHESLPYKAIDGVVDELSDHLVRLPPADCAPLLPPNTRDLARVFPVVAQIPAIGSPAEADFNEDPVMVKRSAFAALRELLARIAGHRPLVVFVDDVHWGDLDSVDVLEQLLGPPDAPRMLLVLASRSEERQASPFLNALHARLANAGLHLDARDLLVGPLQLATSQEFAQALLGATDAVAVELARRIAAESEGHPLLIEELTRYALAPEGSLPRAQSAAAAPLLTQVITQRIDELASPLRALLDTVSLAGAPITVNAACRAAGMDGVDPAAIQHLLVRHLLRAHRDAECDRIAPYHDRIRETVVESLPSLDRRRLHHALGDALLRQEQAPAHVLVTHFEGAGELAIAAKYAAVAADQAAQALAFKDAADMYRKALAWDPGSPADARRLRGRYADALFNQGLCRDAATAYAEAARDAPPAEAGALRTRAALSFMTCGAVDEGRPMMHGVLREVGVSDPQSRWRLFVHLLLSLTRLRLRGLDYRRPADDNAAPAVLRRIDTCYAAADAFVCYDFMRSADLLAVGLRLALKVGDPGRLIQGCALVGGFAATFQWDLGERLIEMAGQLAGELDTPFARGLSHLAHELRCFMRDEWESGLAHADQACQLLNRCAGVTTLQQYAQIQRVLHLRSLERFADLRESADQNLRWAREVGNPYFEAAAHLESALPLIARDDLAGARARLDEALRRASPNDSLVVHSVLTMRVKCYLYEGCWREAHDEVEAHWGALRRAGLLIVPTARNFYSALRAGAALEVAACDPARRDAARRIAKQSLKTLDRATSEFGRGCRAALLAAVASGEPRLDASIALCHEAARHFTAASLPIRAAVLERRAAEFEGSADGVATADRTMIAHGVVDPERWARSIAPGFHMRREVRVM